MHVLIFVYTAFPFASHRDRRNIVRELNIAQFCDGQLFRLLAEVGKEMLSGPFIHYQNYRKIFRFSIFCQKFS